jgi:hypothetical protein
MNFTAAYAHQHNLFNARWLPISLYIAIDTNLVAVRQKLRIQSRCCNNVRYSLLCPQQETRKPTTGNQ